MRRINRDDESMAMALQASESGGFCDVADQGFTSCPGECANCMNFGADGDGGGGIGAPTVRSFSPQGGPAPAAGSVGGSYSLLEALQEPWSNEACLGYTLMGLEACGASTGQIEALLREMKSAFDFSTVEEAEFYFQKSRY